MKSYLVLSVFAASLLFASCAKDTQTQPATPVATQSSIDEMSKKDKHNWDDDDDRDCNRCDDGKKLKGSMTFHISETYDLPCNCGQFQSAGTYSGSGNISHMGNTTSDIKPCIAPIFQGTALVGYHVGVQCGSLKAANGNYLYVNINPYDLNFTNAGAVGVVKIDIIGGTGKFKKATGKFKANTSNDGQGNVTLDIIKGMIDY